MSWYRYGRSPRSVLALATAGVIATALPSAAPARTQPTDGHGAPAGARSVDLSNPDGRTLRIVRAQERYLSSYGSPPPRTRPTRIAAGGDGWTLAVVFLAGAAGAGVIAGRASTHLRRAST
jgi:hypothetical protein